MAWLTDEVLHDATGAAFATLPVAPSGKFWLGILSPESVARESSLGDRADRVTPCEMGFRLRIPQDGPTTARICVAGSLWLRSGGRRGDAEDTPRWTKSPTRFQTDLDVPLHEPGRHGEDHLREALTASGGPGLQGAVSVEHRDGPDGHEAVVTFVNTSPAVVEGADTNLYEVGLELELPAPPEPFVMEALPSSFRYDRRIPVYGVNCGVDEVGAHIYRTTDAVTEQKDRPTYWDEENAGPQPDLTFEGLAADPCGPTRELVTAMRRWRDALWSDSALDERAASEGWDTTQRTEAAEAAVDFEAEIERVEGGVRLLEDDADVRRAFQFMNEAFRISAKGKYDAWRPFQVGFQLATLRGLLPDEHDRSNVDILWFATGGGKTETYLGLVVASAFLDRLTGKPSGVTAWARFPLRMLSLQQTQRFADVLAAAEQVRARERLGGDTFSLGFLVGGSSTPNRLPPDPSPGQPDFRDGPALRRYQVLIRCPFCRSEDLTVTFDRDRWTLDHRCTSDGCPHEGPLPFRIVDDEIFRFLPTVVVGTIDKTAGLGLQASMAGLYGPPHGRCSAPHHGFTYAERSTRPAGCLVPGCDEPRAALGQPEDRFGPTLRIQDELHLLRDSLGAMSSHYEAALDYLQEQFGPPAKILASSATLAGYRTQVEVLYRRQGRVFPLPGPRYDHSFWSQSSGAPLRLYLGLAPRGVTMDFAADRLVEALQRAIRKVVAAPDEWARSHGVDPAHMQQLISDYGTDVSYGSTLRDVEAAARSFETQIPIDGEVNAVTLTGRVPFEHVREALHRLEEPEPQFGKRIHLVAASSMISHGVDVDRLNVMAMMGLPLTTAEFIQATARVGRARPGLVFTLHKMLRERDAAVYRSFGLYVRHGDRLVDSVPVTRRSRSVLLRTFPGLWMARVLGLHERRSLQQGGQALTSVRRLRTAAMELDLRAESEAEALIEMLDATEPLDQKVRDDVRWYSDLVLDQVLDQATQEKWPRDLLQRVVGGQPMLSLRDVDAPVAIYSEGFHDA